MFPLSYLPWAWFKVMDPRLMALPQVRGDLSRVNVCPRARGARGALGGSAPGHLNPGRRTAHGFSDTAGDQQSA